VLERCWSLVSVSSGDSDEEALRVAEAEVSICDQVSDEVLCCCHALNSCSCDVVFVVTACPNGSWSS
jgi:hypothetical protein